MYVNSARSGLDVVHITGQSSITLHCNSHGRGWQRQRQERQFES